MRKFFIFTLLLFCSLVSFGQEKPQFFYDVDFGATFNNLEGSDIYEPTHTLFGVKLAPKFGVQIAPNHSVVVGVDLIQNFGDSSFPTNIDYTIYYHYQDDKFGVYAGSFPCTKSIASYPLSFFREDYYFYDTNIEGLMLQYKSPNKNGYIELFADWYGSSSDYSIDRFFIVGAGGYHFFDGLLQLDANFLSNHVLDEEFLADGAHLIERTQLSAIASTDLAAVWSKFNTFKVGFGTNSSLENKRYEDIETSWTNSIGWQALLDVNYKGWGLNNSYYFGDGQQIYHSEYGSSFYTGNPFYQADRYNRAALYYCYKNKFLSLRADFVMHFTPETTSNQQIITLGVNIANVFKKSNK